LAALAALALKWVEVFHTVEKPVYAG
jgi:hypothetical protein